MFSAEYRDFLTADLVAAAKADPDIVSAAFVGSSAVGGDRWSDLDLTLSVSQRTTVAAVLERWTRRMTHEFAAVVLFDVAVQNTIYRVFLLPGALQIDLSFAPEIEFGSYGPRFRLLFGSAIERERPAPLNARQTFGMAIHHVVRAHICVERERFWQAEYWIHHARDLALELACHCVGIEPSHGRGFDQLDSGVLAEFAGALPTAFTSRELKRGRAREGGGVFDSKGGVTGRAKTPPSTPGED
ncbi:hypothetical protein BH09CHL1_BH09CHL1_37100 [soil metagenome]